MKNLAQQVGSKQSCSNCIIYTAEVTIAAVVKISRQQHVLKSRMPTLSPAVLTTWVLTLCPVLAAGARVPAGIFLPSSAAISQTPENYTLNKNVRLARTSLGAVA